MEFTFYGDLLGIGSAYKLSPTTAYNKLDAFYNEAFNTLGAFCNNTRNEVEMFSDSLFIMGDDAQAALVPIAMLFSKCLLKGLLLRGAIVKGKLSFEERVTKKNFGKRRPIKDTLARANGLEKSQKGARFLIETSFADKLLDIVADWKTHDGYLRSISANGADVSDVLRRICPTPDQTCYEYLYYWSTNVKLTDYKSRIKDLKDIMAMCDKTSREQYEETVGVIDRACHRHRTTEERLKKNLG